MTLMPFGSRIVVKDVTQSPGGVLIPPGAQVDHLHRGIVVSVPELSDGHQWGGGWAPPQPGDVVHYDCEHARRIGDDVVVDFVGIIAVDRD